MYHFRWFNSKGATLVLFWTFMVTAALSAGLSALQEFLKSSLHNQFDYKWTKLAIYLTFLSAPLFGWLADAKLGNYKVFKIGFVAAFVASVLNTTYLLLNSIPSLAELSWMAMIFVVVMAVLSVVSAVTATVNLTQLGLEQLPDGSAEQLASLISWMVFVVLAGVWSGYELFPTLALRCHTSHSLSLYQGFSLLPVLIMSIVLSSHFILSPKYLIIEPKAPQSLKTIFRVLKFATKHKAPLNRSAFTYWEEDVPSRLDLGKSRFGGPFTTEQVEDVKTFLRLLVVSVPLLLMALASTINNGPFVRSTIKDINGLSHCETLVLELFTFNRTWCAMVTVVVYEFLIYPCINYRLPSLMKRIGFVAFVQLLQNIVLLVLSVLGYFSYIDGESPWLIRINSILFGVLLAALVVPCIEFVYAQSPYNMRGLMTGGLVLLVVAAVSLGSNNNKEMLKLSGYPYVLPSIATASSLFAFVLYLIIARWYKMRVRDNEYPQQAVVEEVYDRYLSHPSALLPQSGPRKLCICCTK